ncbi:MAG: hypothetical protein GY851_12895 [bacterium]|nr:hypothetical protein [bacterium]
MTQYAFILAVPLALLTAAASAQDTITFDARATSHTFLGFGTQVWTGDLSVEPVLRDLNMRYVRVSAGHFSGTVDVDGWGDAEHDAAFATEPWEPHKQTWALCEKHDVDIIFNIFGAPENWVMDKPRKNSLNPEYYGHYTKRLAAALASLHQAGVKPLGIEIFNEQDGTWNCYVPPKGYAEIVRLLREELDQRGFRDLLIFGPGIAHIDTGDRERYIDALDQDTANMIGAWSIHGYQWDKRYNHDPAYGRESYCRGFDASLLEKDPDRKRPAFVTEFAPYKIYENEDDCIEEPGFAVRSVEDALSFLNSGANAILFWEAADMSWSPDRHHGLIRLDKTPRPVFRAFETVFQDLPANARILAAPEVKGDGASSPHVYGSAFLDDDTLHIALVSCADAPQSAIVRITGLDAALKLGRVRVFEKDAIVEGAVEAREDCAFRAEVPALGVVSVRLTRDE